MNLLLERLAGVAARKHWIFIIGWMIILGGLLAAKHAWSGEYVNNYTISGSDSATGLNVLNSTFPQQGGYGGQVVFHAKSGSVTAWQSQVNQSVSNVSKLPDVIRAVSPFASSSTGAVSKDGTIAYANVGWDVNPNSLDASYLDKLNNAVAPAVNAGLQVEYGAGAGEIGQQTKDLTSEVIGLSCALVLLLIMFGSLVAAGIPLVAAVFSVLSGLALLGLLARVITFPTTAPTIATLLGLGVAVDYGLFLVARHREQLDNGMEVWRSVQRAGGTSGAAIVVAGGTVAISVLGLYISGVGFVGSLGLAAAIVVVVTMISALTLVPAFMGTAQQSVRALTARVRARKTGVTAREQAAQTAAATHQQHERGAFARWGRMVSDRPWPWAALSVAVLVVLAIPLFSITLGQPDNGTNPTSDSSRRAYDLISQGFGVGANGPLTVVVKLPSQSSSANGSLLSTMQSDISKTAGVASVTPASVNSSGTTAVFNVIPTTRPQATQSTALVKTLRDDVLPKEPATSYVTGTTAGAVDFTDQITSRLAWLIIAVVAISFFLLTAAFRSIMIAVKAAVLNILSIGAAYGVIVAIFQWGWAMSLIGLQSTLPIPAYVPMLVFCIVFGLSMDYEVFLLSRVHEAWQATGDAHRSVAIGIGATARVITTAALIMIVVFTSFVINPDPTVKMLAIGMAFAVLIDASLVRMILVPAIMSLLGAHAWWLPHWLAPVVPNLQLEGDTARPGQRSDAKEEPGQAANRGERRLGGVRHHWWRPGWRPGRRMYAWHVTFGGQPAVPDFAARAQALLRGIAWLEPVPGPWLHLTTQEIGFSDEVSDDDLAAITAAARSRLAAVSPAAVTIGPARVLDEGIGCDAHPAAALIPVRYAVRAAIGEVWGPARVPGEADWWPHVSLAYASADGPSAPVVAALAGFDEAAAVTVTEIQLILLRRDGCRYEWENQETIRIGLAPERTERKAPCGSRSPAVPAGSDG